MTPRLLDLFCGAGGAAMGYHRAGFEVVGVDIEPQPRYPFEFVQADALDLLRSLMDPDLDRGPDGLSGPWIGDWHAIHASPPCQSYSVMAHYTKGEYPRLVEPVRDLLVASRLPYVIENVVGAPLRSPIRLCGSSFGLGVRRHRLFEMSDPPALVPTCSHYHHPNPVDVTGSGRNRRVARPGHREAKPHNIEHARAVMGIDWMTRAELSEAIPPAYTEWIGHHLMASVLERAG